MFQIRVTKGSPLNAYVRLDGLSEVIVGRSRSCDLILTEARVSAKHLRLFYEDGRCLLENLGRFGSTLNGVALDGKSPLVPGDEIGIGKETTILMEEIKDPGEAVACDESMFMKIGKAEGEADHPAGAVATPAMDADAKTERSREEDVESHSPDETGGLPDNSTQGTLATSSRTNATRATSMSRMGDPGANAPPATSPAPPRDHPESDHSDGGEEVPPTRLTKTSAGVTTNVTRATVSPHQEESDADVTQGVEAQQASKTAAPKESDEEDDEPEGARNQRTTRLEKSGNEDDSSLQNEEEGDVDETLYLKTIAADPGEIERIWKERRLRRRNRVIMVVLAVILALLFTISGGDRDARQLSWRASRQGAWTQEVWVSARTWSGEDKQYMRILLPGAARLLEQTNQVNSLSLFYAPDPEQRALARLWVRIRPITPDELKTFSEHQKESHDSQGSPRVSVPWRGEGMDYANGVLKELAGKPVALNAPYEGIRYLSNMVKPVSLSVQGSDVGTNEFRQLVELAEGSPVFVLRCPYVRRSGGDNWSGSVFLMVDGTSFVCLVSEVGGTSFSSVADYWPWFAIPGEQLARYRWDPIPAGPGHYVEASGDFLKMISNQVERVCANLDLEHKVRVPSGASLYSDEVTLRKILTIDSDTELWQKNQSALRDLQARAGQALRYGREQLALQYNHLQLKAKTAPGKEILQQLQMEADALIQDPLDPRYRRALTGNAP